MKLHVFLFFFSPVFFISAQDGLTEPVYNAPTEISVASANYRKPKPTRWLNSAGVAVGQEAFIGAKFGIYREFSLMRSKKTDRNFRNFSLYAGPEASLFVLYAGVFSISATPGMTLGPFTLDNAFTYTTICSPEGRTVSDYGTWNPKLGLQLGPVWLKAGPSFRISGSPPWEDINFMQINGQPCNFEIRYIGRILN